MRSNLHGIVAPNDAVLGEQRLLLGAVAALNLAGLALVWGRFTQPAGQLIWAPLVIAAGVLMVTATYWIRIRWRRHVAPHAMGDMRSVAELIVGWGPSVAIILTTVAVSWPPLERLLDAIVWTPVWVADILWRKIFFTDTIRIRAPETAPLPSSTAADRDPADSDRQAVQEQILQQLKRVRDPSGREIIYGTIRAELGPGERTTSLHVSFCPPLDAVPKFELEQIDGPQSRIKAGRVLAYGARIDVRLVDELDAATSIGIEWAALSDDADENEE